MKRIIPVLAAALTLCGCSSSGEQETAVAERDIFAMDTYMSLKAYGKKAESALDQASAEITELEELLSVTAEGSDIWRINHAEGDAVTVSDDTLSVIETAMDIGNLTDGALDITIYPVLKEWGFTTGEYRIPDSETLAELLQSVDYRRISIDGSTVRIPDGFQIDTGALAKGYTSDKLTEILREQGIDSAIVNLGGNVQTIGRKPDGTLWNVGVKNPFQTDTEMCIVSVEDKAVITSGNYERYFVGEDGEVYWHIMDAKDGYPADNGLVSVTVIGESGILCDALSTAFFVAGFERTVSMWQQSEDYDLILVTDDGEIYITEGIAAYTRMTDGLTAEVIYSEEKD